MRVLFVASDPPGTATYRYRSENLARCLRRAGHDAEVVYVGDSRVRVDADVVVLHRICAVPEGWAFARAARAIGAVLIYSTDDTVFDADSFPESGEPWGAIRAFAPRHAEMLTEADAVLVSTEYIGSEVRRIFGAQKPVFTVRNFLSDELLQLSEAAAGRRHKQKEPDVITLGYMSGSATHDRDIAVCVPQLVEMFRSHPVRLHVVGRLAMSGVLKAFAESDHVTHNGFVPWRKLPQLIATVDVNLSPLDLNHRFVRGKSEIKYLEAAAAGVPTIATATEGFTESVPPDAVSYCPDNRNWLDALERLLHPDARYDLAERAYAHTLAHGTEEAQTPHVAQTFERIANLPRRGNGDTSRGTSNGVFVNYPFAPPKYLAKAILRKLRA